MAVQSNQDTIDIRLFGVVQGVGMRPHVARTASFYHVRGFVRNTGGMVLIRASASKAALDGFVEALIQGKPDPAVIVRMEFSHRPYEDFDGFAIVSSGQEQGLIVLGADLPVCAACEKELQDPNNTRYRHPFISCMACGPRYSIINAVPYDRCSTTMSVYPLCENCAREYASQKDRRFHAQTIACPDCGPVLLYQDSAQHDFEREEALSAAVSVLKNGGIIAVKSTGGYHIACSPFIEKAAEAVRKIKHREKKPFAVLFPDIETLRSFAEVSEAESNLLLSDARPIVLLKRKPSGIVETVFKSSRSIGAFLPSTPIQILLTAAVGPLVMTSANTSDEPIIIKDEVMLSFCKRGLDGVLYHERRIQTGLDDSVLQLVNGKVQFIRRSRGYVPLPVAIPVDADENIMLFAAGSDLKASFALTRGGFAYLSQPFGDMEEEDAFAAWKENQKRLSLLLGVSPQWMLCDLHPNYRTALFLSLSGLPAIKVQHHHAHIASVCAEHALFDAVIGVAFDGTGYGTDGTIWGGEFLLCNQGECNRLGHLRTTTMLGGDNAMREAWKSLLCHLAAAKLTHEVTDERFPLIRAALQSHINTHESSSMGRLFDAICALLGLAQENGYEGECGMLLEHSALEAQEQNEAPYPLSFRMAHHSDLFCIDPAPVLSGLCEGLRTNVSVNCLALGFHHALARAVLDACLRIRENNGVNITVLSGGVFQNALLLTLTRTALESAGFAVYQNEAVPPNDGGIALGQAYIGLCKIKER